MNLRILHRCIVASLLSAQLALVAVPALGESGGGVDDPQRVARELADELVDGMRELDGVRGVAGERPESGDECEAGADPGQRWLEEEMKRDRAQCLAADRSRLSEGTVFCDCAECPVMVVGADGVAISKYPVLDFEWDACIKARVCGMSAGMSVDREPDVDPVAMRWEQAQTYLRWLSRKAGKDYRLPSKLADLAERSAELGYGRDPCIGCGDLLEPASGFQVVRNIGAIAGAAAAELRLGPSRSDWELIQGALNAIGFDAGVADGVVGPRTRKALAAWQGSIGDARTGYLMRGQAVDLKLQAWRAQATVAPKMVRIRGGCFQMVSTGWGDDRRRHSVCVEDFSIGKHEITLGEFARFVRETGYWVDGGCEMYNTGERDWLSDRVWHNPGYSQKGSHPVVCVNSLAAIAYARWLSEKTGESYRLPTDAEWEYAARGGTATSRHWGDGPDEACTYANMGDRTLKEHNPDWPRTIHECRDGHVHTAPVGAYRENGYGLYDMLGNVWEWTCSEHYQDEGQGCASGYYSISGGSWYNGPGDVLSVFVGHDSAITHQSNALGFRLVQN